MPLMVGCSRNVIKKNAAHLRAKGYSPKQALAIAYRMAREYRRMCKHQSHLRKSKKKKRRSRRSGGFLGIF